MNHDTQSIDIVLHSLLMTGMSMPSWISLVESGIVSPISIGGKLN